MQVVDSPRVHLDPGDGTVVVPTASLTVDADALADLQASEPDERT